MGRPALRPADVLHGRERVRGARLRPGGSPGRRAPASTASTRSSRYTRVEGTSGSSRARSTARTSSRTPTGPRSRSTSARRTTRSRSARLLLRRDPLQVLRAPRRPGPRRVNYQYMPDFADGGTLSRTSTARPAPTSRSRGGHPRLPRLRRPLHRRRPDRLLLRRARHAPRLRLPLPDREPDLLPQRRVPLPARSTSSIPFGLNFGGVRGRVFFDIGGAWLEGRGFQFSDERPPGRRALVLRGRLHGLLPRGPLERRLRPAADLKSSLEDGRRRSTSGRRLLTAGNRKRVTGITPNRSHRGLESRGASPRSRSLRRVHALSPPDLVPPRRDGFARRRRADAGADAGGAVARSVDRRHALAPGPHRLAAVSGRERLRRTQGPIEVVATKEVATLLQDHLFNDAIWPDFTRIPTHFLPAVTFRVDRGRGCRSA